MHARSHVARDLILSPSEGIRKEPLVRIAGVVAEHLDRKASLVAPSPAEVHPAESALTELPSFPLHGVLEWQVLVLLACPTASSFS